VDAVPEVGAVGLDNGGDLVKPCDAGHIRCSMLYFPGSGYGKLNLDRLRELGLPAEETPGFWIHTAVKV